MLPATEQGITTTESSWTLVRFFIWIFSAIGKAIGWLSPVEQEYPLDESGELMRRNLAHKSWFDEIASSWVEQSFWVKITVVTGVSLFSALAGLMIGASMVLAISAVFFSLLAHALFVAHEQHRWEGAKISAAEAVSLQQALDATKLLLEEATSALNTAAHQLNEHSMQMQEQSALLDAERQIIRERDAKLTTIIEDVEASTANLFTEETQVLADAKTIIGDVKALDEAIIQTSERAAGVRRAVSQFSGVVSDIKQSQKVFSGAVSEAVKSLGLFAIERAKTPDMQIIDNDFVDLMDQEIADNYRLMEEMQRLMPSLAVY